MATTNVYSGQFQISATARVAFSGDSAGGRSASPDLPAVNFSASGGTAPTISGWMHGDAVVTTTPTDILLAHASDPLQGLGDAAYSDGFTVASSKLKLLIIRNEDPTNSIKVARKATNGLPIFNAASDEVTIQPGGIFLFYLPTGTAALTTGSNDALTLEATAGTPTAQITAWYGP